MKKTAILLALLVVSAPALASEPARTLSLGGFLSLEPVVTSGLASPVGVTHAGDGSGRLFVIEQPGRIRIVKGTQLLSTPFLDVTALTACTSCGERGLLGLAFHPQYATNGRFFIYHTIANGDIQIARYQVSANPDVADPNSRTLLLTIPHHLQANHNGGQLAFGPDGFLYAGVGDGGGGGDPFENGQNKNSLLAKILRLDVDNGTPYGIPASNPFAGATAGADEVWDYGLRNPWRFSFDRQTGDLYIGDVGQNLWEEVDFEPAGSAGGRNYGWDCREGANDYDDTQDVVNMPPVYNTDCPGRTFTDPVLQYGHGPECSITGGYVYRGRVPSSLTGHYVFSDFCSGTIWQTSAADGWPRQPLAVPANGSLTSFGEGDTGRLYVTYLGGTLDWLTPYTFSDVPPSHHFWQFVEAIAAAGITGGCGGTGFCPDASATRQEMAVFLLAAKQGSGYAPPPCTVPMFNDVPCSSPFAPWINELANRGITAGCGNGNYCPTDPVTRAQMAVFLLATKEGTGYAPPACTVPRFSDVPCASPFAPWVDEIAARGITAGCGGGNYCPTDAVTRAQMSVFLAGTFGLLLP